MPHTPEHTNLMNQVNWDAITTRGETVPQPESEPVPIASPESIMAMYGLTRRLPEPPAEPEPPSEPVPWQFFKGFGGGVEDLTKRLGYSFLPFLGERERQIPLPDKKPFIAVIGETSDEELDRQQKAGRLISWVPAHMAEDARKKVEEDWKRGYQVEDLASWEFERNVPETGWGAVGRMIGGGLGVSEPPLTITELQNQPWWLQTIEAITPPGLTGPATIPKMSTVLRGGVLGRGAPRVAVTQTLAIRKLRKAILDVKRIVPEQEAAYTAERGVRGEAAAAFIESEMRRTGAAAPTAEMIARASGKLAGELPKKRFDRLSKLFSEEDIREFDELIFERSSPLDPVKGGIPVRAGGKVRDFWDVFDNRLAFDKLVLTDKLPTRGELKRLENIFGTSVYDSIMASRRTGLKAKDLWLDAWNLPKALIATYDLSAPGRQGWKLAVSPYWKQYWKSFGAQFKLLDPFLGGPRFDELMRGIRSHKSYEIVKNHMKMFEGELSGAGRSTSQAEEAFISNWASKIPGVDIAERAYTGFLNKLRFEAAYKQLDDWARMGYKPTPEELEDYGSMLMAATGRGKLPANMADFLNSAAFSPRFAWSTPQFYGRALMHPLEALKGVKEAGSDVLRTSSRIPGLGIEEARNARVSKIWAQIAVGHVVKTAGILSFFKYGFEAFDKDVEIELDPRATDFGKIRIGKTRYDFWGGDAQWAKFIARLVTQEKKVGDANELVKMDGGEMGRLIWKFIRSKMHPSASSVLELGITKEDFFGNAITSEPDNLRQQAKNRLLFMAAQDILDGVEVYRDEPMGGLAGLPSFIGVGVQTYETAMDIKDEIAVREYGVLYDDLPTEFEDGVESQLNINKSRQLVDFYEERRSKRAPESPDTQWFTGVAAFGARVRELEEGSEEKPGLQAEIESGADGKTLDGYIGAYFDGKREAWETSIPGEIEAIKSARLTDKISIFREKLHSVPLEVDIQSGIPDYDLREFEQEQVIEEARIAGVTRLQMEARGPITSNEVINPVVTQWVDDHDYLRENYYNVVDQFIKDAGYWDYYERFKTDSYSAVYLKDTGFRKILREAHKLRGKLRLIDPEIERRLFRWGRITNLTHPTVAAEAYGEFNPNQLIEAMGTIGQGQ